MSIRSIWRKLYSWGVTKKTIKWTAVYVALKWILTFTLVAYLMRIDKWNHLYWIIFGAIGVIMFFVATQRNKRKKNKNK